MNKADAIFKGHHPGDAGRRVFPHGVPGHSGRLDTPAHPKLCKRVFDDHDERQLQRRLPKGLIGLRLMPRFRQPQCPDVTRFERLQMVQPAIHPFRKDRLGLVKIARHTGVLRTAAGEQEHHVRPRQRVMRMKAARVGLLQQHRRFKVISSHNDAALFKGAAAFLQRPRNIRKWLFRVGPQMRGEACRIRVKGGLCATRHSQDLERPVAGFGVLRFGRFLKHHMRVRPADTQRVHTGAAGVIALGPICQAVVDPERRVFKINGRVRFFKPKAWRHLVMVQGHRRLDQAGYAGRGIKMPDIRLDRSDPAMPDLVACGVKGLRQGSHLNRITKIGARAMAFDIVDAVGCHARDGVCFCNGVSLPLHRGCQIARFGRTVIVDRAALDDRPDMVAIRQRIRQAAQHHNSRARAEYRALCPMVERMALAVWREDFVFLVKIPLTLRQFDGHPTRQSDVAFAIEKRLAGIMRRHQ